MKEWEAVKVLAVWGEAETEDKPLLKQIIFKICPICYDMLNKEHFQN